MSDVLTEDLLSDLLCAAGPGEFLEENEIASLTLEEHLQMLLDAKGLKRSAVVREARLNEAYGYQIFAGMRNASCDKVIQIAFGMHLNLDETNRLLQTAGASSLYCKNRRDAIIIFGLEHGWTITATDHELYRFGENVVCSAPQS